MALGDMGNETHFSDARYGCDWVAQLLWLRTLNLFLLRFL